MFVKKKMISDSYNYGIELLRIVAMLLIIILHILGKGGVLNSQEFRGVGYFVLCVLNVFAYCGVNIYGLISGYVGCSGKRLKLNRFLYLWLEVVFYGCLCLLLLKLFGIYNASLKDYLNAFLPITRSNYWYFTAYTGLFFVIPLLNQFINTLNNQTTKILVIVLFFGLSCFGTIAQNLGGNPFKLDEGYSVVWLVALYIIGALIKKNNIMTKIKIRTVWFLIIFCVTVTLTVYFALPIITKSIIHIEWGKNFLISYISPTILLISICILLLFARLQISAVIASLVAFIAPSTFGIYLFHTNIEVFKRVIGTCFLWINAWNEYLVPVMVLVSAIGVFLVGCIVDIIRSLLFKCFFIETLTTWIDYVAKKFLTKAIRSTLRVIS